MYDVSLGILVNSNTVPFPDEEGTFDEPIPVHCRLVWYRTGEQWIDGTAVGNAPGLFKVLVDDARLPEGRVWVGPEDVVRREVTGGE